MAEKKIPVDMTAQGSAKIKSKKKSSIFVLLLKSLFVFSLIMFIITGGAAAAVVANYVSEAPPLDPARLATVETSYLFDSEGTEITALHDEQNRIVVSLELVPSHVKKAFIAVEDERFYSHHGFDAMGSMRAAYANYQAGRIVQGGSTITQQLAQNAFLSAEITYRRKIQEIWLAVQLERSYGKDEILEMYLNRIYFGNGAYGVEAAARTYFGKSVTELGLAEAAMLAGAVRSPNRYNPFDNHGEARARMETVLSSMERLGFISETQHRQALRQTLEYAEPVSPEYPFPHFVDHVVHSELIRILSSMPAIGSREEAYRAIYNGGLRVYTTLEPSLQGHVEEVLAREDLYPRTIFIDMKRARSEIAALPAGRDLSRAQLDELVDEERGLAQPQAAIVVADPVTGRIKALGGGRQYLKNHDEVLRFSTLRQPGSAIKPIITYAPALEEGTLPGAGSVLDDSPFTGPQGWRPQNFDNRFRGMVPAREALYYSYNVPAVRAFQDLGSRVGVDYARKMGITTIDPAEIDNLSLTLGGMTYGVNAIEMAQAYAVLANEGVRVDLHTVARIEDRHGVVLYEQRVNPVQVISPAAAFIVSDILQDFVRRYSIGRHLRLDRPIAAKTGTSENWKDVYLVAYTPNLVASFWMGYDEPKMGSIREGWRYSTVFLREVFLEAFQDLEIREFIRPDGVVRMEVCTHSGLRPTEYCRLVGTVRWDYFMERFAPRISCDHHLIIEDEEPAEDEETEGNGEDPDNDQPEEPPGDDPPADPPPDDGEEEPPGDEEPGSPPDNDSDDANGGNNEEDPQNEEERSWWDEIINRGRND